MNPIYRRYLSDEDFRDALLASARRQRAEVMARFFAAAAAHLFPIRRHHAPRTHLARQG